jgi:hypothetical protein
MAHIIRTCRGCGCTDLRACPGGCSWVLLDIESPSGICSTCAEEVCLWDPMFMDQIGRDEALTDGILQAATV